jgi:hypothetical protein
MRRASECDDIELAARARSRGGGRPMIAPNSSSWLSKRTVAVLTLVLAAFAACLGLTVGFLDFGPLASIWTTLMLTFSVGFASLAVTRDRRDAVRFRWLALATWVLLTAGLVVALLPDPAKAIPFVVVGGDGELVYPVSEPGGTAPMRPVRTGSRVHVMCQLPPTSGPPNNIWYQLDSGDWLPSTSLRPQRGLAVPQVPDCH